MNSFLDGQGFLGAHTSMGADLSLLLTVVSAVLFTIGWRLASGRRFAAHHWVQTVGTCLTAVVVIAWMIRSFRLFVAPEIPARLGERTYGLTTLHAAVGTVALVFGVYVVLSASGLLPKTLRFESFKPFMRAAYVLYMLGTLTGAIVYYVIYVG